MIKRHALFAILAAGTILAACAGGGGGGVNPSTGSVGKMGNAQFSITVPPQVNVGTRKRPQFVSPNTQSISISVNGHAPMIANLSATSPNCTQSNGAISCTINVTAPVATDTFVVKLYDATNGSGHVLASSSITKQIGPNTPISIVMNGIPANITVYLSNPSPIIGQPAQIQVGVTAMDASGAVIMGPGNFVNPITLSSNDSSGHTSLAATSIAGPSSTVTLNYDGSASVTAVTISASSPGVTQTTPAVLRPANAQNGGGGVAVVNIGADTYAEVPSKAGLIQVKLTNNGSLATTPPSPMPTGTPIPRGTLLSITNGVDSCAIAPINNKINAFCVNVLTTDTPVNVIDLTSGTPVVSSSFATDAAKILDFSGGECYVCGITWDPADSALLLSTGNNPNTQVPGQTWPGSFEFYSTDGTQPRGTIQVNNLAENFGYNSVTNQIFNFGYAEADLVDIASATVYKSQDAVFTTPAEGYPAAAIDASAVDSSTNIGVSTDEFDGEEFFAPMNSAILNGGSVPTVRRRHAAGGGGATFTNPIANVLPLTSDAEGVPGADCEPTAVTVDATSHLAFISGEFSSPNCVAAIQLPSTSPSTPVQPSNYMTIPMMPNTPDGLIFDSARDPHVAATFYLQGTDVYGLVYNSMRSWVAVVDLTKLLAARQSPIDPHLVDPTYDLVANGVVTYLPTGYAPGAASNARPNKRVSRRR